MYLNMKNLIALSLNLSLSLALPLVSGNNTSCGLVAKEVGQKNATAVPATDALRCLQSVPFNSTAGLQFVKAFNETLLAFQSTTAYLKNPPPSYQQPAVDVFKCINDVQEKVKNGTYKNHYEFESDLQTLSRATHDGHFNIATGALGVFGFSAPLEIVSVSSDGRQLPQIYAVTDLRSANLGLNQNKTVSPIKTINDQDAVDYVKLFAAKFAQGQLEPHTDFNSLTFGAAAALGQYASQWTSSAVFTEPSLNITFQNGSKINLPFSAQIAPAARPLLANVTSGQDFYEAFVAPTPIDSGSQASSSASATSSGTQAATSTAGTQPVSTGWTAVAYPKPFVAQPGLGTSGFTTGYMIKEASLGVLSISSFEMQGNGAKSFTNVVQKFLAETKAAGIKHILIDLQGNGGGSVETGPDLFKHFFPSLYPFAGWRSRSHEAASTLGEFYSNRFAKSKDSGNKTAIVDDEENSDPSNTWIAQVYQNANTGQLFGSWSELDKTYEDRGDLFTQTGLDDLSNALFDLGATGDGIVVDGFANRTNNSAIQPYEAQDIVILTDGRCASTCTQVVEDFHHSAGVRTIVVGGLPQTGPMQITGSVRGHEVYNLLQLGGDIEVAVSEDSSLADKLPNFEFGFQVDLEHSGFNLLDEIRANETFPLQFAYYPADCRIFFTPETVNNYTALWMYAAEAMWGDGSLCVQGSTGLNTNKTNTVGPSRTASRAES